MHLATTDVSKQRSEAPKRPLLRIPWPASPFDHLLGPYYAPGGRLSGSSRLGPSSHSSLPSAFLIRNLYSTFSSSLFLASKGIWIVVNHTSVALILLAARPGHGVGFLVRAQPRGHVRLPSTQLHIVAHDIDVVAKASSIKAPFRGSSSAEQLVSTLTRKVTLACF